MFFTSVNMLNIRMNEIRGWRVSQKSERYFRLHGAERRKLTTTAHRVCLYVMSKFDRMYLCQKRISVELENCETPDCELAPRTKKFIYNNSFLTKPLSEIPTLT